MAPPNNIYAAYKKDTKYLVYWLIHVTNRLIKSDAKETGEPPEGLNTTGQTTIANLVSMADIIAKHAEPVPSIIYNLFQSIIDARTTVYTAFQQMSASNEDPHLQRSNAGHKHFIDVLIKAFKILGGDEWKSCSDAKSTETAVQHEEIQTLVLGNKFSALQVEADGASSSDDEDDGFQVQEQGQTSRRGVKKSSGKGKKGKKTKKGKSNKKTKKDKAGAASVDVNIDDIPLESFKIIDSEDGLVSDYLMATYSAAQEWTQLRTYIQGLWRQVAHNGLNSAVAGAMCNIAIAMIKRTTSVIFVDFPGHESYYTIMNTITRGDPAKAQGNFHLALHQIGPGNESTKVIDRAIDVKEQFMIHAYYDLTAFVTDFQQTRSGKPTKAMNARLSKWSPNFNLQTATEEERVEWRRSYTIMWLYDLVNVFSAIVVQRNTLKGEKHVYERVDWSPTGPWDQHRRLFGPVDFAGEITKLAMQKPGTDIKKMILPQHVFHLQCIVDSFAVSRGWSVSGIYGHVMRSPASEFRPRRDVDLFLDRLNERVGHGFLQSVDMLKQIWDQSVPRLSETDFYGETIDFIKMFQEDFVDWLGETKYMHGLNTIPPSRFSSHNSNGLYEYSPFLCGTGLLEGLDLTYRFSMILWDRMREPMLIIHLHNMLVQKKYITEPIGVYQILQDLLKHSFFVDGKPPTSDFSNALLNRLKSVELRFDRRQRQSIAQRAAASSGGIHTVLDLEANTFFQQKSTITLHRTAQWNPDGIPDKDLAPGTLQFYLRLYQTKPVVDPKTGEKRLPDTLIVRRARELGMDDEMIFKTRNNFLNMAKDDFVSESTINDLKIEGLSAGPQLSNIKDAVSDPNLTGTKLLDIMRCDILSDICGMLPLSSFNYVQVTSLMLLFFLGLERRLKEAKSHLYTQSYEQERPPNMSKRSSLVMLMLDQEDDEGMKIAAEEFERMRTGFMNFIYWEDLVTSTDDIYDTSDDDKPDLDECTVM